MGQAHPSLSRDLAAAAFGALAGVIAAAVASFLIAERVASWIANRLI